MSLILQFTHNIMLFSILSLILFVQFELETILVINYSSGRIFVWVWWKSPGWFLVAYFEKERKSKPSKAWFFLTFQLFWAEQAEAAQWHCSVPVPAQGAAPSSAPGTLSPVFIVAFQTRCAFLKISGLMEWRAALETTRAKELIFKEMVFFLVQPFVSGYWQGLSTQQDLQCSDNRAK